MHMHTHTNMHTHKQNAYNIHHAHCAGRRPFFEGLGLAELGVAMTERNQIKVMTCIPSMYAHTHMYTHTHKYTYTHTRTHTYTHIHTHTHTSMSCLAAEVWDGFVNVNHSLFTIGAHLPYLQHLRLDVRSNSDVDASRLAALPLCLRSMALCGVLRLGEAEVQVRVCVVLNVLFR